MAGIFLLACIGVGVFVFSRERDKPPVRYRAVVTVQIAASNPTPRPAAGKKATTTLAPVITTGGVGKLATSTPVRSAALKGANLAPTIRTVGFRANVLSGDQFITLTVTAPTRVLASTVATSWGKAFTVARREAAHQRIVVQQRQLHTHALLLRTELLSIDTKLAKLLPGLYAGVFRIDKSFTTRPSNKPIQGGDRLQDLPRVLDSATPYVLNLALERPQLIQQISDIATRTAELSLTNVTPDAFAKVLRQTPAQTATKTRSVKLPAAGGLLGGLALGIAAAVALDRRDRRIRDPRAAATAFGAPVLSLVPWTNRSDYVILSDPLSNVAEAYRGLAATSIATDRLPKAIMVSTPHGDAHEDVAANYAAALSRFGLKVALIATGPDQAWYADRFDAPSNGTFGADEPDDDVSERELPNHAGATFPELLVAAHAGTLNGNLFDQLASNDRTPNLMVVPPSDEAPAHLPVDGLPPLLEALADAGIDITVVSGPALLEDADATIVAWATRCVLWAIVEGEITSTEARAAAARLELAGVVPFGVVMVGLRSNGI